jgi:hypothetical protein
MLRSKARVVLVDASVNPKRAEGEFVEMHMRLQISHALFFEVIAEKGDQRCSTRLLPQRGHSTLPSS